jgi:hypothetical protein
MGASINLPKSLKSSLANSGSYSHFFRTVTSRETLPSRGRIPAFPIGGYGLCNRILRFPEPLMRCSPGKAFVGTYSRYLLRSPTAFSNENLTFSGHVFEEVCNPLSNGGF